MVLLLNYLHWFILAATAALVSRYWWKWSKEDKAGVSDDVVNGVRQQQVAKCIKTVLVGIVLAYVAVAVQTSYVPRGTVQRVEAPTWEPLDVPVEDRLRTTAKPEKQAKEDFDAMVDWRAQKAKRDAAVPTDESTTKE